MYEKRRVKIYFKIIKWVKLLKDGCACMMILYLILCSIFKKQIIMDFIKIVLFITIILQHYIKCCPNCGEIFGRFEEPEKCIKCGLKLL